MSTLTSATYLLAFDDLVKVEITATNSFGASTASSVNTAGARIRRIPDDYTVAPTISAYSDTSITVSWSPLTGSTAGNSAILSYELQWDQGTATFITVSDVLSTSYVVTGLTASTAY